MNSNRSAEQIINGFNELRSEQRGVANKVLELEADLTEHKLVLEALDEMDSNRKCFRMIGGILVERTVKEVLPSLTNNQKMISSLIETLKTQIVVKGKQITEYMDKHHIQIRQEPSGDSVAARDRDNGSQDSTSASVLV